MKKAKSRSNERYLRLVIDPMGTRTPVSGVRGQRPRPLDDGAAEEQRRINNGLISRV